MAVLLPALLLRGHGQESQPAIVVVPFSSVGVSRADVDTISTSFESGIRRTGAFSLMEQDGIAEILGPQAQEFRECMDRECAVKMGRLLSARYVVLATLQSSQERITLNGSIIDVDTEMVLRTDVVGTDSLEEMLRAAETLAFRLAGVASGTAPAWLLFEKGKLAVSEREYGKALNYLLQALDKRSIYPEVEMEIGNVFVAEGELSLAEEHYLRAYEYRSSLAIPEERHTILLRLAWLYKERKRYKQMAEALLEIANDDPEFADPESAKRKSFQDIYRRRGLDRLLELQRHAASFAAVAHSQLGWFYYRTGFYQSSIIHYLFAVVSLFTDTIRELRRFDVEYAFSDVSTLLSDAFRRRTLADFLRRQSIFENLDYLGGAVYGADIFRCLYYLAGSTYATGNTTLAMNIWSAVAQSEWAYPYSGLAEQQIMSPVIEDLLSD